MMYVRLWIAVMAVVLCSCGTSKRTEVTNRTYKSAASGETAVYGYGEKVRLARDAVSALCGMSFRHVVYDTSKPDGRGGHPVLSETTVEKVSRTDVESRLQTGHALAESRKAAGSKAESVELYKEKESGFEETQIPRQVGYAFKWLSLVLIVAFLWYAVRIFRK